MKKILYPLVLLVLACLSSPILNAQSLTGTVNLYLPVTGIDYCQNTVTISGSTTGYNVGDRVLLIQMKGATINQSNNSGNGNISNINSAGLYEFGTIASTTGTSITLANYLVNTYQISGMVQIIRVETAGGSPSFSIGLSGVSCPAWNATTGTGGVIVIENPTGTMTMNGHISADGKGFRGGAASVNGGGVTGSCATDYFYAITNYQGAEKGEGIAIPASGEETGAGCLATGGGGGNDINCGGGGGSNYGGGGSGGDTYISGGCSGVPLAKGGRTLSSYGNTRLFLGGGGGGGQQNNGHSTPGAAGGGIIIIHVAQIIANTRQINANGLTAANSTFGPPTHYGDGAGGGGAGGTIAIECSTYTGSLFVNARGGKGGNTTSTSEHGPGGGGGGGKVLTSISSSATISTIAGLNGFCAIAGSPAHGATSGSAGTTVTTLSLVKETTPFVALSATANGLVSVTLCAGEELTLHADNGPLSGTYSWSGPGLSPTALQTVVFNVTLANSGTFVVSKNGCDYSVVVNVENCCTAGDPASGYDIYDASSGPLTTNQDWDGKVFVTGGILQVTGNVILDITNVDVVFDECSGIQLSNGATIRANNSVFRPCLIDHTWNGIEILGPSENNIFDECVFKNAITGIRLDGAKARLDNNIFMNNNRGVSINNVSDYSYNISGNRFVVDKILPVYSVCGGTDGVNYGIESSYSYHSANISQNFFVNYNENPANQFHGIMLNGSGANITSNTFTNMYRAVDVSNAGQKCNIENNDMEINRELFTNVFQVNITFCTYPVFVFNNRITDANGTSDYTLTSSGIYANDVAMLYLKNNTVRGFETGIELHKVNNSLVTENMIFNAYSHGIYIDDCYSLTISCNEIDLDFKGSHPTAGMGIYSVNADGSVTIHSNCIRDCHTALSLLSNFTATLPDIRNNFLYNYTDFGILTQNYNGNIGNAGSPGMNTFYSNSNAQDVWNNTPGTLINLYDNFNQVNFNPPEVMAISNNDYHSTASCGQQTMPPGSMQRNLVPDLLCDNYDLTISPLMFKSGFKMGDSKEYSYHDASSAITAITSLARVNLNEARTLTDKIAQQPNFSASEKQMIRFALMNASGDLQGMQNLLSSFIPANTAENTWLVSQQLLLKQKQGTALTPSELALLRTTVSASPENGNRLTGLLMANGENTDFYFLPKAAANNNGINVSRSYSATSASLQLYPNPATNSLNIRFTKAEATAESITVVDLTGRTLLVKQLDAHAGEITLDVSGLAPGAYVVFINHTNATPQVAKFVKN